MDCKAPTCYYSKKRNKCVRPNSYIETLSWCRRNKINTAQCRELYYNDKKDAKNKACERYAERLVYVPQPKKRRTKMIRKSDDELDKKNAIMTFSNQSSNNKSNSVSITSKSFKFSRSNKVFRQSPIVKKTAKYFKTRKTYTRKESAKTHKDLLLKDINKRPKLHQRVFLKDLIDADKKVDKQISNIEILPILSPKSEVKSISNISKKIRQLREKYAANKLQKFIMKKIIKRLETLDNRIVYYKYINEYLKNTPDLVCLKSKKYADKSGNINDGFELGSFLKLVKKIGTESVNGVIYKTVAKNVILTLATKIMPINNDNKYEIRLNEVVTEIIKRKLSKHFLMAYKSYQCHEASLDPKIPKIVHNNHYLITLNELAHGDVKSLCHNQIFLSNNETVANIALQCLLSIATFHSLDYSHNDCHWGNFLFHVSSKELSGWYEYSIFDKTYYVKNCGYNVMIYDFGLIKQRAKTGISINRIVGDYVRIMHAFIKKTDDGWLENYPPSYDILSKIMYNLKMILMQCMVKKYDDEQIINSIIHFYLNKTILNHVIVDTLPIGESVLNKDNPFIITKNIYEKNNVELKKHYLRKITPKKN